jgi:hypothetical protein
LRIRFLMNGEILRGFCVSGIFEFKYVLDLLGVKERERERQGTSCDR